MMEVTFAMVVAAAALLVAVGAHARASSMAKALIARDKDYRDTVQVFSDSVTKCNTRLDNITQRFDMLVWATFRPAVMDMLDKAKDHSGSGDNGKAAT